MRMRRFGVGLPGLAAGLAAAMAVMTPGAGARADEGMTLQGSVEQMPADSGMTGCQASFGVGRRDSEYGHGGASLVIGSLAIGRPAAGGPAKLALRLGVLDEDGTQKLLSGQSSEMPNAGTPVKAVLLVDGGDPTVDNGADALGVVPAEKGFAVFLFADGPVTRQVLAEASRHGRFKLKYAMQPDGPMARVAVDVTVAKRDMMHSDNTVIDPKAAEGLAACVATVGQ